jgi:hypothetical protein
MADVKFDIEVTGIKELKDAAASFDRLGKISAKLSAQYKPLGAQTTRLVQEQKRLTTVHKQLEKAVEDGLITDAQANKAMAEQERLSKERILTDKTLIAQAKKRAKAEKELQKETARLVKEYAPARTAADLYRKKLKEIDQALHRNVISSDEAAKATATLKREFHQFTSGLATGGNQFAKFNVEAYKANQRTKRFASVGLQQAGYQVGDFAVQLQGGTNIAVAFGQQMSQLLGIFGAGGAIAGAGVAIATAFIAPLIDAKRNAKGFNDTLETIGSTISSMESLGDTLRDVLVAPFFEGQEVATSFFTRITQEQEKRAGQTIASALGRRTYAGLSGKGILYDLEKARDELAKGTKTGLFPALEGEKPAVDVEGVAAIDAAMKDISRAVYQIVDDKTVLRPLEEIAENLVNLSEAGRTSAPTIQKAITDLIQSDDVLLGIYEKTIRKRIEASEEEEKLAQAALERSMALQEDYIARAQKAQAEAIKQDETDKAAALERSMSLQEALIARGQKSQAERDAERQAQEERAMALQEEMIQRGQEAQAKRDEANHKARLKHMDLEAAKQVNLGLVPYGVSMPMISGAVAIYKDGQKGKGKDKETKDPAGDALKRLKNQLELETLLLGKFGEQRDLQGELIQARQQYSDVATPAQMLEIENTIKAIDAMEQKQQALEDIKDKYEDIGKTIAGSMDQAFMSVVTDIDILKDSFEDMAFKVDRIFQDMARDIIAHLYQVLVVQQMVRGFGGMLGKFSNPILSAIGAGLESYDGGGYTGSGPRSGGLDGKGGYMAMLHPRETVIDHTKGQSTGGDVVNVTQNINVSTGVQQTVRAEIKQLMPQIADSAKSAVVDAKRRGGSYGRAFA